MSIDYPITARVRRLSRDETSLYIGFSKSELSRTPFSHGQAVEVEVEEGLVVAGILKTSGGSPWLAPWTESNAEITAALRAHGLEHSDDVPARLRMAKAETADTIPANVRRDSGPSRRRILNASSASGAIRIDADEAKSAVRCYNEGRYRGRLNTDIDREAYRIFESGLPSERERLIEVLRFVGEEYGGAPSRFLPEGIRKEAIQIADQLLPLLDRYREVMATLRPLVQELPDEETIEFLFAPFIGTKRWPVWASKTLHFLRPDVFPILDSRAKKALGMASLGSSPRDYRKFCVAFRGALIRNASEIDATRTADGGASPSDVKLLDKILYQLGA